mgnify:CR=1 FL=1
MNDNKEKIIECNDRQCIHQINGICTSEMVNDGDIKCDFET